MDGREGEERESFVTDYNLGLQFFQGSRSITFTPVECSESLWSLRRKFIITKLQRIQNHAARLVLKKAKRDHVTPLFRKLHWLPLQARIDYKICVMCFKCINKIAPSYLSDLLEQYVPSRLLRSGSQNLLKKPPRANKKCTEKAFKHCAPYIWNSLPSDIREAKSESQFKNDLKTHLFKSHLCIRVSFDSLVCMRSVCVCTCI